MPHPTRPDYSVSFGETVDGWKKKKSKLGSLIFVGFGFWLIVAFWPAARWLGVVGFLICWVIAFWGGISTQTLSCPACRKNILAQANQFCPECGTEGSVVREGFLESPKCGVCYKPLRRGKSGASYTIRFCTHCGVKVSETGIR